MSDGAIEGVMTRRLTVIPDERGRLMEILRRDDDLFSAFGQVYLTTAYPGVVKAWHAHDRQDDCMCCVRGMIKLVLFDARPDSPSHGQVSELFLGDHSPLLVRIPRGVLHGFKNIARVEALIVNVVSRPYDRDDPDERRIPVDDPSVPYDWTRRDC